MGKAKVWAIFKEAGKDKAKCKICGNAPSHCISLLIVFGIVIDKLLVSYSFYSGGSFGVILAGLVGRCTSKVK